MIKINVTSEKQGDNLKITNTGKITGERAIIVQEMAAVLKEFHSLDDGEILVRAFGEFMWGVDDDESES